MSDDILLQKIAYGKMSEIFAIIKISSSWFFNTISSKKKLP